MLPEKRKKLIITSISIIVMIFVIIGIAKLSSYIKRMNTPVQDLKNNDTYPSKYQYYGFSKDQDNIYKLYGIMGKDETYLNLRTFYNIKDYTLRNNKLVIYSDAINEIRYDSKEDEF